MNRTQEMAKFAAGAAAWEALGHTMLAFSGLLPLSVWGITVTHTFNTIWIMVVAGLSMALAWYAWVGGKQTTQGSKRPSVEGRQAQL